MKKEIIKCYCDECMTEVNENELYQINYKLSSSMGSIGSVNFEVCDKCFNYYSQLFRTLEDKIKSR
jgi:hypothetical protein